MLVGEEVTLVEEVEFALEGRGRDRVLLSYLHSVGVPVVQLRGLGLILRHGEGREVITKT